MIRMIIYIFFEFFATEPLFEMALKDGVCIISGHSFYLGKDDVSTMHLNFSCMDEATIEEGIKRLGKATHQLIFGT